MEYNFSSNNSQMRTITSPFSNDTPRAFLVNRNNKHILAGPYLQTIWNFANYKKYNLHLDIVDSLRKGEIFYKINNGSYNISLHGGIYGMSNDTLQFSYPLETHETCIVVPLEDELPKFYYIVWPLGRYIWLTLALGTVYVAYLMHMLENPRKQHAASAITRNILYSAALLLYCSNMDVPVLRPGVRHMIFYFLLIVLSFIISAFHISHMTALCMKPAFRAPIDTMEQLLDEKLSIIVTDNTLADLRDSEGYKKLEHFENHLNVIAQSSFIPLVKTLSRSYAYMVTEDQWDFMYRQQRYLKKPYFHRSKMCFQKRYLGYPMNLDAATSKDFQIFQLLVKQSGLWNEWNDEGFRQAVHAGYAFVLADIYPVLPLDMYFFRFGWVVIIAGLIVSCCAMFIEYFICPLFKRKRNEQHIFRRRYEKFR